MSRTARATPYERVKDLVSHYRDLRGPFARYRRDPAGYARDVLQVNWWSKQVEVAEAIPVHRRVFVKASHNVGKTHLAGGLVSWVFDSYRPSITKTTAPRFEQVKNLTWREVRAQRQGRDMLPMAPTMYGRNRNGSLNQEHFAMGVAAGDSDAFQGTHEEFFFMVFEEAVGIKRPVWVATDGMLSSGDRNFWLAIMNPTDSSSAAFQFEMMGGWKVITISALEHPNIRAELLGKPRPYPKAIALSWVRDQIAKNCKEVSKSDRRPGDIQWPPADICEITGEEPKYFRPNADFEGRVLGRWPSQPAEAVWSEAMWDAACVRRPELWELALGSPPEIGCDRARFGDDYTAIHVRRGPVSLYHESFQGRDTTFTLARLKELAGYYARVSGIAPQDVLVKVDDFGGGVVDPARADGYKFVDIPASSSAIDPEHYKNRRSELWFGTAERANAERLDVSAISDDARTELRRRLMAPRWAPNSQSQRVVEEKKKTKERIKRSPDDADAMNLAYAPPPPAVITGIVTGYRTELETPGCGGAGGYNPYGIIVPPGYGY